MKVAFVVKYFLPEKTAGTEVYAAALCRELRKLNVDVVIIKPGLGLKEFNEYYYEQIRVLEYPQSAFVDKDLKTGKRKPEGLDAFKELLISEKLDAIHFHEITGSNGITLEHLRIAEELNISVFMTLHLIGYACQTGMLKYKDDITCNGIVDTFKCSVCTLHKKGFGFGAAELLSSVGYWLQKNQINISFLPTKLSGALSYPAYTNRHISLLNDLFSISEKVFVLSSWFKELLLVNGFPEEKMVLLPKALPGQDGFHKKQYLERLNEPVRFVYLARVSRIKGLHTVLKALKDLKAKNWSLDIYGQVEEEDYYLECNKIVEDSDGAIKWMGIIKPENVVETLQHYDALIFPTIIQEMVGLVVQEAFAAGIPVIGSDARGIAEQVTDRVNGLLFKAGDTNSLKEVLNEVMLDKTILPILAANIKTPGSFTDIAVETLRTYTTALENKNSLTSI